MTMLPPYEKYQACESRWLARVPAHWSLSRAKYFLQEIDDRSETGEETLLSMRQFRGLVPHNSVSTKAIGAEHLIGYKRVRINELVLNRMQAGNAMFFASTLSGLVSPDYAVFRLRRNDNPEYLGLLFRSYPMRGLFRSESKGLGTGTSGFLRLYSDRFSALRIPVPTRGEQDQIVNFLRAQDAHIARFIKSKRQLIDLLIEQKAQLIGDAVTQGIVTSENFRLASVDWFSKIPEHWNVVTLKQVADIRFSGVDKHSHADETAIRLCNYTDVYKNAEITAEMAFMVATATKAEITRLTLQAGDVIITKDSETPLDIAVPAWVPQDLPGVVCGYHLGLLRPDQQVVSGEFLFRCIGAKPIAQQFHVLATGVTRFALSKHDVRNAVIPLPPLAEQTAICRWIEAECKPLDEAIRRTEDEIQLIREYRDRLIADVVTGQIDVRNWVPGPDDIMHEADLATLTDNDDAQTEQETDDGDD